MIMMGGDRKKMASGGGVAGPEPETNDLDPVLHAISEELIDCVHAKDAKGVADALHAAFSCMDASPHEEGPHLEGSESEEG